MVDYSQYKSPQEPAFGGNPAAPNGNNAEFFNSIPNVSPEMINMGFSAGQDIINKQKEKWMPGMSSLWVDLKCYFAVNKNYVIKKLTVLMYPPSSTQWARIRSDDTVGNGMSRPGSMGDMQSSAGAVSSHKWALPRDDVNSPDLYIPVMSFLTYCILICYAKRAGASTGSYVNTPDVLINAVWKCCILQVFEAGLIYGGLAMMSVSLPFLDIVSYTGYKYVGLCASTVMLLFGSTIYFLSALYTSAMLGYFVLKSLAAVVPKEASGPLPRHIMLVLFAALQFLIAFILSCY